MVCLHAYTFKLSKCRQLYPITCLAYYAGASGFHLCLTFSWSPEPASQREGVCVGETREMGRRHSINLSSPSLTSASRHIFLAQPPSCIPEVSGL